MRRRTGRRVSSGSGLAHDKLIGWDTICRDLEDGGLGVGRRRGGDKTVTLVSHAIRRYSGAAPVKKYTVV